MDAPPTPLYHADHVAPGPADLHSLLPPPARVTHTREDETFDTNSNSPPFYGFSDSFLQSDSASVSTSPTSQPLLGSMIGQQIEMRRSVSKDGLTRSDSMTPPLAGYNSDLQPDSAVVSTPVKVGASLPKFSPAPPPPETADPRLHYHQLDPGAMFECTKCENLFVDYQDVLDHVDTFHPSLDTDPVIREPEPGYLVSQECSLCRARVVGSREVRLMLDHLLVEHGEGMVERDNILWSCRMCDTQAQSEETMVIHVRENHASRKRKQEASPMPADDSCNGNQPFIKRFKAEVEKRLRKLRSDYANDKSVPDSLETDSEENDSTFSDGGELEKDEGLVETKSTKDEDQSSRSQRLTMLKYNLEVLLEETKDLKRLLVIEKNNNII